MNVSDLKGPDLAYWVARANLRCHPQDENVKRAHYGDINMNNPVSEPSMREFVSKRIGSVLPDRNEWH